MTALKWGIPWILAAVCCAAAPPQPTTQARPAAPAQPTTPARPAAPIAFQKINVPRISTIAPSDDGQLLFLAHEEAGKVSVYDVARGAVTRTLETPTPSALLCRAATLYVANYDAGTISTFRVGTWSKGKSFPAGDDHP